MFTSDLIRRALEEDIGHGDITSAAIVPAARRGRAVILAKSDLVLAGMGIAIAAFTARDPRAEFETIAQDGVRISAGSVVLEFNGNYRAILSAERVALNFLQRLSGIATMTRKYVDLLEGNRTKILDTRKTQPLYRHLERYAVRMGGGQNHRAGLYDQILIKENHIAAVDGSIEVAISMAFQEHPKANVIVEIRELSQVEPAIAAGASRLLLDNMDDASVRKAIDTARDRVEIEVSGGITPERVRNLSRMGVNYISVGAITHSAPAADLSLLISSK